MFEAGNDAPKITRVVTKIKSLPRETRDARANNIHLKAAPHYLIAQKINTLQKWTPTDHPIAGKSVSGDSQGEGKKSGYGRSYGQWMIPGWNGLRCTPEVGDLVVAKHVQLAQIPWLGKTFLAEEEDVAGVVVSGQKKSFVEALIEDYLANTRVCLLFATSSDEAGAEGDGAEVFVAMVRALRGSLGDEQKEEDELEQSWRALYESLVSYNSRDLPSEFLFNVPDEKKKVLRSVFLSDLKSWTASNTVIVSGDEHSQKTAADLAEHLCEAMNSKAREVASSWTPRPVPSGGQTPEAQGFDFVPPPRGQTPEGTNDFDLFGVVPVGVPPDVWRVLSVLVNDDRRMQDAMVENVGFCSAELSSLSSGPHEGVEWSLNLDGLENVKRHPDGGAVLRVLEVETSGSGAEEEQVVRAELLAASEDLPPTPFDMSQAGGSSVGANALV